MKTVFVNQTTNATEEVNLTKGGPDSLYIKGQFGTAYVHLEISPDEGVTWVRSDSGEFSYRKSGFYSVNVASNKSTRAQVVVEDSNELTDLTIFFG